MELCLRNVTCSSSWPEEKTSLADVLVGDVRPIDRLRPAVSGKRRHPDGTASGTPR